MQTHHDESGATFPGSDALEQAVLDSMLHDETSRYWMLANLQPGDFLRDAHRRIFSAICDCVAEHGIADLALTAAKLKEHKQLDACGGVEYLKALGYSDALTIHPSQAQAHAEKLRTYRTQRDLLGLATRLRGQIEKAPHDPQAALSLLQSDVDSICERMQFGRGAQSMQDVAGKVFAEIDADRRRRFEIRGLRCGIPELDVPFGGLGDQALVLILGLSGFGKTTLAGQYVFQTAIDHIGNPDNGQLLAYVLEGTTKRFLRRFLSWQAQVPMHLLKPGGYADTQEDAAQRIATAQRDLQRVPMAITDAMNNLADIETDVRNHAMRGPLLGVMIDHAQLFAREGSNRVAQLEDAATRLQILADDVKAPILLLSQVTMFEGEAYAKHAKGLFEACSLVFQLDRGEPGQSQEEKRRSDVLWVLNSKARDDDPLPPVELRAVWSCKRVYGLSDWQRMHPGEVRSDGRY